MRDDMQLAIVASLLRRGKPLDQLSTGLTLLSLLGGLTQLWINLPSLTLTALMIWIVTCGVIEKYYSFRVAFDADLFAIVAAKPGRTADFDSVMIELKLLPVDKAARPWGTRCQGALELLRFQILFVVLQLLSLLIALSILPWLPFTQ